jgi:hypothetical protein
MGSVAVTPYHGRSTPESRGVVKNISFFDEKIPGVRHPEEENNAFRAGKVGIKKKL